MFPIESFSCIVFDEIHHMTGNHVYVKIMKTFVANAAVPPRILGLSASPVEGATVDELVTKFVLSLLFSHHNAPCANY